MFVYSSMSFQAFVIGKTYTRDSFMKLENEFANGYNEGNRVLYVSMFDMEGGMDIGLIIMEIGCSLQISNDILELSVFEDKDLQNYVARYFSSGRVIPRSLHGKG